jgi:RimJ/RimL family protein N-acetyltransferase
MIRNLRRRAGRYHHAVRDRSFTTIGTERLVLRRFAAGDLDTFARYRADPDVARFQSWQDYTREDAERFIEAMSRTDPGVPGEWFQFAVAWETSPARGMPGRSALVGDCALVLDAGDPPTAEIGYTLDPAFTGRGYATEAVRALVGYAFDRLGVTRVRAVADTRNAPSIKVAERLGMSLTATLHTSFKGEPCEEHTYELTEGTWRAS